MTLQVLLCDVASCKHVFVGDSNDAHYSSPRPGGIFRTVMRSPEGQEFPNAGCYLEVIENEQLVWTNALDPGFRPANPSAAEVADCGLIVFTAIISLAAHGSGTRYTALAMHKDEEGRKRHEEMGFLEGLGKALDQLVAYMKKQ